MFERIKTLLRGRKHSMTEQAETYVLTDKPFSRALLLRASQYGDEAEHDLKEMFGSLKPIAEAKTLDEFAASCAVMIAFTITSEAMKSIGRDRTFMPYDPVPKDALMVVAFSLFVLVGIHGKLKAEGFQLDFTKLALDTACLFFMYHPVQERVKNVMEAQKIFKDVAAKADAGNVREWHDNLMQLIPMYVLQWTTESAELKKLDFIPLFGSMLSGLLKAVE